MCLPIKNFWQKNADTLFGGITIICGIVGTLVGGIVLDRMNSTIKNAFKVAANTLEGLFSEYFILV